MKGISAGLTSKTGSVSKKGEIEDTRRNRQNSWWCESPGEVKGTGIWSISGERNLRQRGCGHCFRWDMRYYWWRKMPLEWDRKPSQRSSKLMASIFLSEVKEFRMQKVKEERVKQKLVQKWESSWIFSKRSGKGSWQQTRRILSSTLMTQLWSLTFIVWANLRSCVIFFPANSLSASV